ncbi:MAG: hypothetical protein ACFWT8_04665 [Lacticaseibacillus casei]
MPRDSLKYLNVAPKFFDDEHLLVSFSKHNY